MVTPGNLLIIPLLRGFEWFDETLQRSLREAGWQSLTRPESIVMTHVQLGIVRPAEIARSLRLTRQAVHVTIKSIVERGMFRLVPDPEDGRIKIVELTELGQAMRQDAILIVQEASKVIEKRIGKANMEALLAAFATDWGEPETIRLPAKASLKSTR